MTTSNSENYGAHRVLEPLGVLPQQAWRLDNSARISPTEMRCDVTWLNIDTASFRQIADSTGGGAHAIGEHIWQTVKARGKQHNSVTGSGGMFIGRVAEIGATLAKECDLDVGEQIASLVSLTLTPLLIEEILDIDVARSRLRIRGHAIVFASGIWTRLPDDLPTPAALALFDVAGAPALVTRLASGAQAVAVIGADGKSGLLSCAAATKMLGSAARVYGVVPNAQSPGARFLVQNQLAHVIEADARNPVALLAEFEAACPGLADAVINCVNVPGTELGSILCARERGTVCFFSMATTISAAALGAEGLGRDVDLLIGNGYVRGHVDLALATLRAFPALKQYFIDTYGDDSR